MPGKDDGFVFVGGGEDDGVAVAGAQHVAQRIVGRIVEGVAGVGAHQLAAVDNAVMEPEPAQALEVAHGGGERELFDRGAVVVRKDGEAQLIGMIAVDGGDEVDVRVVDGEALDIDLHAEALDGGIVAFAGKGLERAGGEIVFAVGAEIDPEALAVLAGIEAAGLELTEGHAAHAAAGAEDDGLDGDVVEQLRLAGGGRNDADTDEPARPTKASG